MRWNVLPRDSSGSQLKLEPLTHSHYERATRLQNAQLALAPAHKGLVNSTSPLPSPVSTARNLKAFVVTAELLGRVA